MKLKIFVLLGLLSLLSFSSAQASALACEALFQPKTSFYSQVYDGSKKTIAFENIYNSDQVKLLAEKKQYIRRPSASEIEAAIAKGLFPNTPEVRAALFVIQEGHLNYQKPGQLVIAQGNFKTKKWNEDVDFNLLEKSMKTQFEKNEIVGRLTLTEYKNSISNLKDSDTNVGGNKADRIYLITLKDGTRGVFKAMSLHQAVSETAAYLFSKALGLKLVPPTVMVRDQGQIGSLQYFIENPNTGIVKDHGLKRDDLVSEVDLANMDLFYIMSGNWDAHLGNRVVDLKGGLGLIDNEGIKRPQYYRFGELPWVGLIQKHKTNKNDFVVPESDAFPFHEAKHFNKPSEKDLKSVFKSDEYDLDLVKSKFLWYQQDSGKVGVIDWKDTIWVQLDIPEYYQARKPTIFPQETMQAASRMTLNDLRQVFQEPFREFGGEHVFTDAELRRVQSRIQEVLQNAL